MKPVALICGMLVLPLFELRADDSKGPALLVRPTLNEPRYTEDRISVQAVSGALFSQTALGPDVPTFNYSQTNIRLGWMLNTPDPADGVLAGNWEALIELSANGIFEGSGNVMIGPAALVRYNFVQPDWKVVPYVQAGLGFVYTDAYEDKNQRAIGQAIEFTPQAGAGVRILVSKDWSVDVEGMFHHVSNAGMADRNLGINAVGGLVGATYHFEKLWQ